MGQNKDLEHYIPLRRGELIDELCAGERTPAAQRDAFRRFCWLISASHHFEYDRLLEKLKDAYAPFDPDADTKTLSRWTFAEKQQKLNHLFTEFAWLMERANFRHLSRDDLEPALAGASAWGIPTDVDFRVFERLAIFARGDTFQKRTRRRLRKGWRREEVEVPIYQRLVMILKLRPHRRLGPQVRTDCVYFQLFKDIPKLDISMLLPGARVKISNLDRSKVGLPFLGGLALTLWRLFQELAESFAEIFLLKQPAALGGLAAGALGYGFRSFYGYRQTKQRYHLALTQMLYFQNLDTNAGVLYRLLDDGEEQDCREAILAYYYLWRCAGDQGWAMKTLDDSVVLHVEQRAKIKVDFEIDDALANLERLGVVEKVDERYRAMPLEQALAGLEMKWRKFFDSGKNPAQVTSNST